MKFQADLFPYPVLNEDLDDFIQSSFTVDYSFEQESQSTIAMNIVYNLDNSDLLELIEERKASYAVHLEGVSSSFRILETSDQKRQKVLLNADNLSENIEVNFFVMANTEIINYRNSGFNSDYYGDDFVVRKINKSDILAFQNVPNLKIDFENKISNDATSMIWVTSSSENYMSVDMDGDIIQVKLPKKAYYSYISLSKPDTPKRDLLLTAIILPALTFVIERIKDGAANPELQWYNSLIELLDRVNINSQDLQTLDSMRIAQQLLDYPVEDSIVDFHKWEEDLNE